MSSATPSEVYGEVRASVRSAARLYVRELQDHSEYCCSLFFVSGTSLPHVALFPLVCYCLVLLSLVQLGLPRFNKVLH